VKKGIVALAAAAMLAVPVATASGQTILRVADPTPTGTFTDAQGNAGYGEIRDDGVRACNENETTPAGDQLTGYAWIDAGGDAFAGNADDDGTNGPTYGNGTIGAGDYDGEGVDDGDDELNGTEGDDCPGENAP
jgi:hypothetical protein